MCARCSTACRRRRRASGAICSARVRSPRRSATNPPRRARAVSGADRRRERERQGAGRARDSPARRRATRAASARSTARRSATSWSRPSCSATRAARSPAPRPSGPGCSRRPTAARCSSTRWGSCRRGPRPSCCACCRKARCGASARTCPRRVDVRIVAATNRRLEGEAADGAFRADLRFRLDVLRIAVPPLRERSGDIPLLAQHFWQRRVRPRRLAGDARARSARGACRATTGPATSASCRTRSPGSRCTPPAAAGWAPSLLPARLASRRWPPALVRSGARRVRAPLRPRRAGPGRRSAPAPRKRSASRVRDWRRCCGGCGSNR